MIYDIDAETKSYDPDEEYNQYLTTPSIQIPTHNTSTPGESPAGSPGIIIAKRATRHSNHDFLKAFDLIKEANKRKCMGDLELSLALYETALDIFAKVSSYGNETDIQFIRKNMDPVLAAKNKIKDTIYKRKSFNPLDNKYQSYAIDNLDGLAWSFRKGDVVIESVEQESCSAIVGVPTNQKLIAINGKAISCRGHTNVSNQLNNLTRPIIITFEKTNIVPIRASRASSTRLSPGRSDKSNFSFFEALLGGELIPYIGEAGVDALCYNLPLILSSIRNTPLWLHTYRVALADEMNKRLDQSEVIRQFLGFELSSSLIDKNLYNILGLNFESVESFTEEAIEFWCAFARSGKQKDERIVIPNGLNIYDPVCPMVGRLEHFKVLKVMKSKTQPLLLESYLGDESDYFTRVSTFFLKAGDDVRQDACVLHLFNFINYILNENDVRYRGIPVRAVTYKVIPITNSTGIIECVKHCMPLKDIKKCAEINKWGEVHRNNLVASAAASYIASYIIGIRDRHDDNILVKNDGTLFHIDFGFFLGQETSVDACAFAVTPELLEILGDKKWSEFVQICLHVWKLLQSYYRELIDFARCIFSNMKHPDEVQKFIEETLAIHLEPEEGLLKMQTIIDESPNSWKTWWKNKLHNFANR